jgi:hypothetical protein
MLEWFSKTVLLNIGRHKDAKNMFEGMLCSSDAFCFTLVDVLLNLCDPFTDPNKNDLVLIHIKHRKQESTLNSTYTERDMRR